MEHGYGHHGEESEQRRDDSVDRDLRQVRARVRARGRGRVRARGRVRVRVRVRAVHRI